MLQPLQVHPSSPAPPKSICCCTSTRAWWRRATLTPQVCVFVCTRQQWVPSGRAARQLVALPMTAVAPPCAPGPCPAARVLHMATFSLQRMAAGGMRDHLGGGFHRYSVDEHWHVPHFEVG